MSSIFMLLYLAPSSYPVITRGYSIDPSTVAIQWDPPSPDYHNGIIRQYWVNIYTVETRENRTEVFTDTVATIAFLIPSFSYHFSVTAFTVAAGPYSTIISITMPEDGN